MAHGGVERPPYGAVVTLVSWATTDAITSILVTEADDSGVDLFGMPFWRFLCRVHALMARIAGYDFEHLDERMNPPAPIDTEKGFEAAWESWGTDASAEAGLAQLDRLGS